MAKRTRKTKPRAEAEVESYRHEEARRKNIPTAENQKLVADEDKAVKKLRWPRNPDLDPQLVWRGKDSETDPLEADAPPRTYGGRPMSAARKARHSSTSSPISTGCRRDGRRTPPRATTTTKEIGRTG
jgi:hypothetical protein